MHDAAPVLWWTLPRPYTRTVGAMDASRLPELIEGDGVVLRRWRVADAPAQHRAILESIEHLRPWMPWIAEEPQPLERRAELIAAWEREWELGGDVYLAIMAGSEVAGGAGLHRRIGPGGLEIGYWLHPAFTGRGLATAAAWARARAALALDGIDHVEIRHDRANAASGAVPVRLGFVLAGEQANPAPAPADSGTDLVWRMTRPAVWHGAAP
jgi:ribosomal-protein-serine acetyltransferase